MPNSSGVHLTTQGLRCSKQGVRWKGIDVSDRAHMTTHPSRPLPLFVPLEGPLTERATRAASVKAYK